MSGQFMLELGALATVLTVLLVVLGHIISYARKEGARDEREREMRKRVEKLEEADKARSKTDLKTATDLAVMAQAVSALKEQLEGGLNSVGAQLSEIFKELRRRRPDS